MRQWNELEVLASRESQRELTLATLIQDLIDFDALMKTEYGHGRGRVQNWVFARLGLTVEDRGLFMRMMEALDLALDKGNGAIKELDLKLSGDDDSLVYSEKRSTLPMVVAEADAANVQYWLRLPSVAPLSPEDQKYVYHLGKRGVDGLLEHLGLGAYAIQEKFGLLEVFRHWRQKIGLDRDRIAIWWVDGDRRSFVLVENSKGAALPTMAHFFQLGGGYWGSRSVSFDEAAALGQQKGRRVGVGQISAGDWDSLE